MTDSECHTRLTHRYMYAVGVLTDSQLGKGRQSRVGCHVSAVVASPISRVEPACTHTLPFQYA